MTIILWLMFVAAGAAGTALRSADEGQTVQDRTGGVRFASGNSALGIPFELIDNRIFLDVSVNGSPPLSFILDTGANRNVLNLRQAKSFRMGLEPVGKVVGGIGAEPPDAYLVKDAVSFGLPGARFVDEGLVALSLDETQDCLSRAVPEGGDPGVASSLPGSDKQKRRVDGILGLAFLQRVVVDVDYDSRRINLYDPRGYKYTGKGKSLPLAVDDEHIFVHAQVKAPGRPPATARLVVDTGAGALSLTKQFAEAHHLLPAADKLTPAAECGIAGVASDPTLVGTLEALEFGGVRMPQPLTAFYQRTRDRQYDGLLGGVALRNVRAIFDYTRKRMIVEPAHRDGSDSRAVHGPRHPPASRLVSIGTHRLEVTTAGTGTWPVVFEGGLGNALETWQHVLSGVSAFAPVVAYSRSGLGESEPGPEIHTAGVAVRQLHALLDALHVPRPVVLVGASYGGLLVRLYTSTYPSEVAGLVLVEGVHEQQVKRFGALDPSYPAAFAKSFDDQLRATPPPSPAEAAEMRETVRIQNAGAVDGLQSLPDIPIAVLTSMKSDPNAAFVNGTPRGHDAWRAMHDEWCQRSSNAIHLTTSRSGHHIQDDEPVLVVDAITFVRARIAAGR